MQGEVMRLLVELESRLPPTAFDAARERGNRITLNETVLRLLEIFERTEGNLQVRDQSLLDPLTERELEILRLMAEGMSNPEIAERLIISVGTVKWHTSQIFSKLHVPNRVQAIARARELELLT
jgi:LuxR family maltose regulon positive regulatory protein